MQDKPLRGKVAVVAGATRGAGRGIAVALGEAGATVYATGRSVRGHPATPGRPETIEETVEMINARGGVGIAVRVDHTVEEEVKALFERVDREQDGRLDILVNDIWGGDELKRRGWGKFWEEDLDKGFLMMDRAIRGHIITSRYGGPLLAHRRCGLIVEITDGTGYEYRGSMFYSLCKVSAIHLAEAMAKELDRHLGSDHEVTALALTPGFLRSERMLEGTGVTEDHWRDLITPKAWAWAYSESPLYIGRAVVALATDPNVKDKSGKAFSTWGLVEEYGFTDYDGTQPNWGRRRRPAAAGRTLPTGPAPIEDWFNNPGTSNDGEPMAADLDGFGWSLSAQALAAVGVTPGGVLTVDGIAFHWPQARPGTPDNVVAGGQELQLPARPGATRIGFLGVATFGPSMGRGEIRYADGSTEPFSLCLPDWGEGSRLPPSTQVALRMPRRNTRNDEAPDRETRVFATILAVRADKTAVSVLLPRETDRGLLHIYAVALGGAEE